MGIETKGDEKSMEKMGTKESAATRATLYELFGEALATSGYQSEPIKGGRAVNLGNGYWAKVNISIPDATKWDIEAVRAEYREKVEKDAESAAKAAAKAAEKARKLEEKAAKETAATE